MKHRKKWAIILGIAAAGLGVAWLAVAWWLPSDKELAARLVAAAEDRLGVKVTIASAHWALLPNPVVVVEGFHTVQTQPVVIGHLSAYPNLRALFDGKLLIDRIAMGDAVFPRVAVIAFHTKAGMPEMESGDGALLEHLVFRNLTWIAYSGIAVAYDGEIDFAAHWRPRSAQLRRPGAASPFTLTATRDGDADRWQMRMDVGGGTANGSIILKAAADGTMHLSGHLTPRDIEVNSALTTFNRRSSLSGKASGETSLSADGMSFGELARSFHTQTLFSVDRGTVLRFDLDKAVRTAGLAHDGQTALQALTGRMDTQNTVEGLRVTYTGVKASAGIYTVTGKATVHDRQVEASGSLDLVRAAISVPFTMSGSVDKQHISVPPGFFAGAAIGTAVLPGIGTAIGGRIGGAVGRVFDADLPEPVEHKPR